MDSVVNIINALGINSTLWVQLGVFVFSYLVLSRLVFSPYYRAFHERQSRTVGDQYEAEKISKQALALEEQYKNKIRDLNNEVKSIYDAAKLQAAREQDQIQNEAKEKAKATIDRAREKIQGEVNKAREDLIKQTPQLSQAITSVLISQEVK